MGVTIKFTDNSDSVLREFRLACRRILGKIGIKAEGYAKKLCPVGTVESTGKKGYRGGSLRNSITHEVMDEDTLAVGAGVDYAPYVELGTGPYFRPPPEWETFDAPGGSGVGSGYVTARPFIQPAITGHADEYKQIAEDELNG